jgi:hypothetical protein
LWPKKTDFLGIFMKKFFYFSCLILQFAFSTFLHAADSQTQDREMAIQKNLLQEKPNWLTMPRYKGGRYVQFNIDLGDFCAAMMVKMGAQTLYTMAHTGTRIENFKTAVFRPGMARAMINWGPFVTACYLFSCVREKQELLQSLQKPSKSAKNPLNQFE